ncbi:ankyrin repeat domain-containing protein [bacterium]|nr:ankyrin repeat domain-containing protein [candidate division CSSED10-310 bacterium]
MKIIKILAPLIVCMIGCGPRESVTPGTASSKPLETTVSPPERKPVKPAENTIFSAAANDQLATVMRMLNENYDINTRDEDGMTALSWAAMRGRSAVVKYLLEHNADPNLADNKGLTPLHKACLFGDKAIIQLLVDFHADVNASGPQGLKPLAIAERMNHQEAIAILKSAGAQEK